MLAFEPHTYTDVLGSLYVGERKRRRTEASGRSCDAFLARMRAVGRAEHCSTSEASRAHNFATELKADTGTDELGPPGVLEAKCRAMEASGEAVRLY